MLASPKKGNRKRRISSSAEFGEARIERCGLKYKSSVKAFDGRVAVQTASQAGTHPRPAASWKNGGR